MLFIVASCDVLAYISMPICSANEMLEKLQKDGHARGQTRPCQHLCQKIEQKGQQTHSLKKQWRLVSNTDTAMHAASVQLSCPDY